MAEILHITTPSAWAEAQDAGVVPVESLTSEGFVHCSTREQLPGTLARHFAGVGELVVLVLDEGRIAADLRWEESRPGELYPHLYAPLPTDAVLSTEPASA